MVAKKATKRKPPVKKTTKSLKKANLHERLAASTGRIRAVKEDCAEKPKRTRAAIGKQARAFGHAFEREIVHRFRVFFAAYEWSDEVRRSDQAHKAWLPDVAGVPGLWPECQVAEQSTPEKKLAQAIRDSLEQRQRRGSRLPMPVAITRRKGTKAIKATLTLGDLAHLFEHALRNGKHGGVAEIMQAPVSLDVEQFMQLFLTSSLHENYSDEATPVVAAARKDALLTAAKIGEEMGNAIARDTKSQETARVPKPAPKKAPRALVVVSDDVED
jgi:hypothetical protein